MAPNSQDYFALIGDMVGSRDLADRREIQSRLIDAIEQLNESCRPVSALALTAGDEVQVLLDDPPAMVEIVIRLADAIHPERFLFGFGRGPVTTELDENVARIDGPCFHRAREALDSVKGEHWLVARGFGAPNDEMITALFSLIDAVRKGWSPTQFRYIRAVRENEVQKDVARRFDVTPATVSESLKNARFASVVAAETAIGRWLHQLQVPGESERDGGNP